METLNDKVDQDNVDGLSTIPEDPASENSEAEIKSQTSDSNEKSEKIISSEKSKIDSTKNIDPSVPNEDMEVQSPENNITNASNDQSQSSEICQMEVDQIEPENSDELSISDKNDKNKENGDNPKDEEVRESTKSLETNTINVDSSVDKNVDSEEISSDKESEIIMSKDPMEIIESESKESKKCKEDANKLPEAAVCEESNTRTENASESSNTLDVEMQSENPAIDNKEKNGDVENTEFVQYNQEKDDTNVETNQSDATDPFGGDLSTQNNDEEPMEVDGSKSTKDNEDTCKDTEELEEKNKDQEEEKSKEVYENIQKPIESDEKATESNEKEIDSSKKGDESSTEILPGQDNELCIIPDSEKEKPKDKDEETADAPSTEKNNEVIADEESVKDKDKQSEEKENSKDAEKPKETLKVAALTTGSNDIQVNIEKSSEAPPIVTSDVIELEDDDKGAEIQEISSKEVCKQCKSEKPCPIKVKSGTKMYNVCSDACKTAYTNENIKAVDIPSEGVSSKRDKRCANCLLIVEAKDERNLSWETMEFCNEECLGKFQTKYGSYCRNCNGPVQPVSLGKYCVRFGYDVRQFCCSTCLEEFKKGLKVCSYCQKDISSGTEGFLAPVGDKGQFKDFCTQDCMEKYSKMNSSTPPVPEKKVCSVCQEEKLMHCEVQIERNPSVAICSEPCFAAFKFVNKVDPDQCSTCKKYFQLPTKKGFVVFYEDEAHTFCNKTCLNVFIITNRKIVPCNWCKVKKYNFDMIKKELKNGQVIMMCSLNCLTLYQVSINAVSARRINCDFCKEYSQAQYHLTMSDATIRNFCSYNCVMNFQSQYTKSPITIPATSEASGTSTVTTGDPVPTGIPKRAITTIPITRTVPASVDTAKKTMPVISNVTSLAAIANGQTPNTVQQGLGTTLQPITLSSTHPVIYRQQLISRPTSPVEISNKITQCKPRTHTKGVSVRPIPCDQSTQTEGLDRIPVPIPVPIYVPFPMHMYSMPYPIPVPIPIPIPVPIFIPTTRNSAKGIFKEIKRIQEKIPNDPFEAELLMMAEMVATEKKNESDSDSNNEEARDDAPEMNDGAAADAYSADEGVDSTNAFGEDMLQMALKMATGEIEEPAVDLETALTPNTIHTPQRPQNEEITENNEPKPERLPTTRGRKRGTTHRSRGMPSKRGRRSISSNPPSLGVVSNNVGMIDGQVAQPRFVEPAEKPDANMALKYTFGVNAWRQWVITKNVELEKQSTPTRKLKLFKTDLLQLTADELNYTLCLFVKEVRKPSGAEYAPDTIYYLCLGIQQYLFENGRIDNIFTDAYYEKFTDCLNEVAKKFTVLYNDALYVVTRVEEEHLWECKQLGAHSPHVLLNTLMYFNTKHFNLITVEEHMQLSFSHIMKHWKRNTLSPGAHGKPPNSRSVLLRFYPPQSALESNSKKKKVYEQQENEENPLRCPVKLYEFYLSKCPESVKSRNDVFYLLPERSCVPDSPVWYSTSPLPKDSLIKMLHRIKMVKEINVSLLSC